MRAKDWVVFWLASAAVSALVAWACLESKVPIPITVPVSAIFGPLYIIGWYAIGYYGSSAPPKRFWRHMFGLPKKVKHE